MFSQGLGSLVRHLPMPRVRAPDPRRAFACLTRLHMTGNSLPPHPLRLCYMTFSRLWLRHDTSTVRSREAIYRKGCRQPSRGPCKSCVYFRLDVDGKLTKQENVRGVQWVKNYKFDFRFQQWGECNVTFTCVAGHIVAHDFSDRFRKWGSCQPVELFEAPIQSFIADVR